MRAKFLFLAEQGTYREDLRLAQAALSELALAFSHSFLMREMTVNTKEAIQDALQLAQDQDALLLAGSSQFVLETAQKLGAFAGLVQLNQVDVDGLSRLKAGAVPAATLVWPLDEEEAEPAKTAVHACALAKQQQRQLAFICTQRTAGWQAAINKAALYAALSTPEGLSLDQALAQLLYTPDEAPLLMVSARDAAFIRHLLTYLGGTEQLLFEAYLREDTQIQAVLPFGQQKELPFFAMLYAAADALRQVPNLKREADCLQTAISNVLASGWRTSELGVGEKTISREQAIDLVSQQVQLAGALHERLG